VVFVAQVDVDLRDIDRPGRDKRAFDEAVRVALEIKAVLEGARLAFVDVDRAQTRRRLRGNGLPFAPRGKPAPPRPRRPEFSITAITSSRFLSPSMHALASA